MNGMHITLALVTAHENEELKNINE